VRRRDFLINSSTSAVFSIASLAGAAAADAAAIVVPAFPGTVPVGVVLYEPRYAASRDFARSLAKRGARAFSTQDDVVGLWRGVLGDCLDCGEPRIAGLTLHSDLEVMRACARDRKLRVLRESLHRYDTSSPEAGAGRSVTLASWLIGR